MKAKLSIVALALAAGACGPLLEEGEGSGATETQGQALNLGTGQDWPILYGETGARVLPCGPGRGCRIELPLIRHDAPGRLSMIRAWSGDWMDGLEFTWVKPDGGLVTHMAGGKGGRQHDPELLAVDEFVVRVELGAGKYVDWIQFHTNKRSLPKWGGNFAYFDVDLRPTHEREDGPRREIHGFLTRSGKFLDQIGFIHYGP